MAATFDKVEATTIQTYIDRKWADNFFTSRALWFKLKDRAKTKSGGTEIRAPIMFATNDTAASYSGYDLLGTAPQQPFANAAYNWKQYSVSVTISGREQEINQGESEILDLLEGLEMNARESLFRSLNIDAFADGTGNGSRALDGLAIQIDSTGTLGGIAQATYAWWASTEDAMGGALTILGMRNTFNDITQGTQEGADLIVTTQAVHEAYEGLLQPDMRFQDNKMADGGFKNLTFKGVPIVWDPDCTTQTMYFINSKYLQLVMGAGRNFKMTEFVRPANQDAKVAQVLFMGNMVGSNRRKQGKITGITG